MPNHFVFKLAKRSGFVLLLAMLSACSSQQLYGSGQSWQRMECNKIMDAEQRGRCMKSADTRYDTYQQQADQAKSGGSSN